ncbi:AzlD domain-containing protein [Laceyella tengchongensis]
MSAWWIILGMSVVTMVPRLLPAWIMDRMVIPGFVDRLLKNIPYAALGALIFPGVLLIDSNPVFGLIGGGVAVVLAYFRMHMMLVIIGAIAAVMVAKMVV